MLYLTLKDYKTNLELVCNSFLSKERKKKKKGNQRTTQKLKTIILRNFQFLVLILVFAVKMSRTEKSSSK